MMYEKMERGMHHSVEKTMYLWSIISGVYFALIKVEKFDEECRRKLWMMTMMKAMRAKSNILGCIMFVALFLYGLFYL